MQCTQRASGCFACGATVALLQAPMHHGGPAGMARLRIENLHCALRPYPAKMRPADHLAPALKSFFSSLPCHGNAARRRYIVLRTGASDAGNRDVPSANPTYLRSKANMPTFATIGPEGSDHHFVLQRYLASHGITEASRLVVFDDFHCGARDVVDGGADYLLQCAVHPAAAEIASTYRPHLVVVDAFISPSRPMALVRAREGGVGRGRVAVQPASQNDADLSCWSEVIYEPSVAAVQNGLRARRYEAGIVFMSFALANCDEWQVLASIGTACEAWIVYGREAVDKGDAVVWRDSPVAHQYWLGMDRSPNCGGS